jgi:CRISPR-associated endoribonuclease Cas6
VNPFQIPPIQVARFRFTLEAIEPLYLPAHLGSSLRGGFGYAFKKMVCAQKDWRGCTPCKGGNDCPYGYIFETTRPEDSQVLRSLREIPTPFVIEPPLTGKREYQPGDQIDFELVLVGRAINYIAYFLLAFKELGRMGLGKSHGKYILQRVTQEIPWKGERKIIYDGVEVHVDGNNLILGRDDIVEKANTLSPKQLTLEFLTQTRIKHQNDIAEELDFHILVRGLVRRLSSLSYFHCGLLWEVDFRGIIEYAEKVVSQDASLHWVNWERFSGRQKQQMNLGGITGEITYYGDLEMFRALLVVGELIHVGKATVFGNGKYRILSS